MSGWQQVRPGGPLGPGACWFDRMVGELVGIRWRISLLRGESNLDR